MFNLPKLKKDKTDTDTQSDGKFGFIKNSFLNRNKDTESDDQLADGYEYVEVEVDEDEDGEYEYVYVDEDEIDEDKYEYIYIDEDEKVHQKDKAIAEPIEKEDTKTHAMVVEYPSEKFQEETDQTSTIEEVLETVEVQSPLDVAEEEKSKDEPIALDQNTNIIEDLPPIDDQQALDKEIEELSNQFHNERTATLNSRSHKSTAHMSNNEINELLGIAETETVITEKTKEHEEDVFELPEINDVMSSEDKNIDNNKVIEKLNKSLEVKPQEPKEEQIITEEAQIEKIVATSVPLKPEHPLSQPSYSETEELNILQAHDISNEITISKEESPEVKKAKEIKDTVKDIEITQSIDTEEKTSEPIQKVATAVVVDSNPIHGYDLTREETPINSPVYSVEDDKKEINSPVLQMEAESIVEEDVVIEEVEKIENKDEIETSHENSETEDLVSNIEDQSSTIETEIKEMKTKKAPDTKDKVQQNYMRDIDYILSGYEDIGLTKKERFSAYVEEFKRKHFGPRRNNKVFNVFNLGIGASFALIIVVGMFGYSIFHKTTSRNFEVPGQFLGGDVLGDQDAIEITDNILAGKKILTVTGSKNGASEAKKLLDNDWENSWKVLSNQSIEGENYKNASVIIDTEEPFFVEDLVYKVQWSPDIFYEEEFGDSAILRTSFSIDNTNWTEISTKRVRQDKIGELITVSVPEETLARYIKLEWLDGKRGEESVWNGQGEIFELQARGRSLFCNFDNKNTEETCGSFSTIVSIEDQIWNYSTATQVWESTPINTIQKYENICESKPINDSTNCKFDTHNIYSRKGKTVEAITSYGKYWNFEITEGDKYKLVSSGDLKSIPRYFLGPCTNDNCQFDTRTFYHLNGQLIESITSNGSIWNYSYNEDENTWYTMDAEDDNRLETNERYLTGPCKQKPADTPCKFDTRANYDLGAIQVEYITAYGKQFIYSLTDPNLAVSSNELDLKYVDLYKNGPCPDENCKFNTLNIISSYIVYPWNLNGTSATLDIDMEKTVFFNQNNYWVVNSTNETTANGNIMDLIRVDMTVDKSVQKHFELNGITAGWQINKDNLILISKNEYIITNSELTEIITHGKLSEHRLWSSAPPVNKLYPWDGNGISAGLINPDRSQVMIVNDDKYWIQNAEDQKWIESGYVKNYKKFHLIDNPPITNNITAMFLEDKSNMVVISGNKFWRMNLVSLKLDKFDRLEEYERLQNLTPIKQVN